jgi:hypothetical protein
MLLDEMDAGVGSVFVWLNAAIANGHCTFVTGPKVRGARFVLLAAANTYGRGADQQYVGRAPLDAATLDRFTFAPIDYDQALERELAATYNAVDGPRWCLKVQSWRNTARDLNLSVVISTRAVTSGAALLKHWPQDKVAQATVWKGIPSDQVTRIIDKAGV